MGKFVKGDIVVIPFPFTDLSGNKNIIKYTAGHLSDDKTHEVLNAIVSIINSYSLICLKNSR